MNQHQQTGGGAFVRRYEDEAGWTVAADVGVTDDALDVDVVGRTVIVVAEGPSGVHETEFDLPGDAENVVVNNGVLVVTGGSA